MSAYHLGMLVVVVVSYLIGSVPTAYLVGRLRKINIFEVGSGNMGATNIERVMGRNWGIAVMLIDMLKGAVAIYISQHLMPHSKAASTTISAISVIMGHNWSLFATILTGKFRGGKGASTAFGTMMMIAPVQVWAAMAVVAVAIVARTRYVSLGVLTAFALAILWVIVLIMQEQLPSEFFLYAFGLTGLLIIRFKDNIQRLLAGTERRIGDRAV